MGHVGSAASHIRWNPEAEEESEAPKDKPEDVLVAGPKDIRWEEAEDVLAAGPYSRAEDVLVAGPTVHPKEEIRWEEAKDVLVAGPEGVRWGKA